MPSGLNKNALFMSGGICPALKFMEAGDPRPCKSAALGEAGSPV